MALPQCEICLVRKGVFFSLSNSEELLVQKLFLLLNCQTPLEVKVACEECLRRICGFKILLKDILVQKIQINMSEEKHTNKFNCSCANCQTKYGSLPLLVEVIENTETKTEKNEPSTSHQSPRKEMKCSHCDKVFTHKGDLNKHIRIHTGEQPFSCTVCNRKFAHTSNLGRHMRLHTGTKPFLCPTCDKAFSRKDKLDLHCKGKFCRSKSKDK